VCCSLCCSLCGCLCRSLCRSLGGCRRWGRPRSAACCRRRPRRLHDAACPTRTWTADCCRRRPRRLHGRCLPPKATPKTPKRCLHAGMGLVARSCSRFSAAKRANVANTGARRGPEGDPRAKQPGPRRPSTQGRADRERRERGDPTARRQSRAPRGARPKDGRGSDADARTDRRGRREAK